jgi:hypothetical protein
MVNLTKDKLIEKLKKINSDPTTREFYSSKVSRIINFLSKTAGFKVAAVKEGGSRGKGTDTRKSDVDIIYSLGKDQDKNKIKKELLERAKKSFTKGVHVHTGKTAVHIDYNNPPCNIDLVYKTKNEFQQEAKKIKQIKKLQPMYKNAIKLAKYALVKIPDIHGYEVELACLQTTDKNLVDCVNSIIIYFRGRIEKRGKKLDQILQRLIS